MTHDSDLVEGLTALFDEAGKAHHQAFAATDGEDSEWAEWYATYAHDRVEALLDIQIPEDDLAALFQDVEERRRREGSPSWPRFYARFFAERFGE